MLRYRMSTLLVITAVVAVAAPMAVQRFSNRPLPLETYSNAKLQKGLANKQPVLIFFTAMWNPAGHNQFSGSNGNLPRIVRDFEVVAMRADCTNPSSTGQGLATSLGISHLPACAVFMPGNSAKPIVIEGVATDSALLNALRAQQGTAE